MEKKYDDQIINAFIATQAVGSWLFWFVLKTRTILLTGSLLFASVYCLNHSINHQSDASLFTWVGVVAGVGVVCLLVNILSGRAKSLPELEHVDHKVDDRLWANW